MVNRILSLVENALVVGAFFAMMAFGFANVIARYFLNISLAFSIEIVINLAVLVTMVATSIGIKHGSHLGFELLKDSAPKVLRRVVVAVIAIGTLFLFGVLFYYGLQTTLSEASSGQLTPAMGLPKWIFSAAIPFGALLSIIRTCQVFWLECNPASNILPDSELRERGITS